MVRKYSILTLMISLIMVIFVKQFGVGGPLLLAALLLTVFLIILCIKYPEITLLLIVISGYSAPGVARYVSAQTGLLTDGFLILAFISLALKRMGKTDQVMMKSPFLSKIIFLWILYNIIEIANPEAVSRVAWFYAMRSVAGYMMIYFVVRWCRCDTEFFERFIMLWLSLALFGAIWGIKQKFIVLDAAEYRWLYANRSTHMLAGGIRFFSFFSDSAQYGVNQAYSSLLALILLLDEKKLVKQIFYGITFILCFYGMLISGTRSASLAFPLGLGFYLTLKKKWKLVIPGFVFLLIFVYVMRYTYIGQSNYDIRRLRSAFKPIEDPSFQVRLANQRKLLAWLPDHPLGGGVGSAGYWGLRFSPDTFLANLALDSWYVKITAEQGWVGLILYAAMVITGLISGLTILLRTENERDRIHLLGFLSVYFSLLIVSYSNQFLGQIPTGSLVYIMLGRFSYIIKLSHNENDAHHDTEKAIL